MLFAVQTSPRQHAGVIAVLPEGLGVCLHEAKNIPRCVLIAQMTYRPGIPAVARVPPFCRGDVASPSDPFVEISALGAQASFVRKNLGHGLMHGLLRTPAHCSTVIKDLRVNSCQGGRRCRS